MGKIKNGFVTGPVGPVTYRKDGDQQIIQSRPGKGNTNMSEVTMEFASSFSIASALGSNIRECFQKSINGWYEGKIVNQLNGLLNTIVTQCRDVKTQKLSYDEYSFKKLAGFEFNPTSALGKQIGFDVQTQWLSGQLKVTIPRIHLPLQLKFPAGVNRCELCFSLGIMRPQEGYRLQYPERRSMVVLKHQPETEETVFTFNVPEGCLYLLTLGLRYVTQRGNTETLFNSKTFNPVGILEAYLVPGIYSGEDGLEWIDMPRVKIN